MTIRLSSFQRPLAVSPIPYAAEIVAGQIVGIAGGDTNTVE